MGSRRKLTEIEKAVIVGTVLGDGCVEKNGNHARLRIGHGLSQYAYVEWKFSMLGAIAAHPPRFVEGSIHPKTGIRHPRIEFHTYSLPELDVYRNKFYINGKKQVPEDISNLLTQPLSLALWFMDDGYKRNDCNALRISTDSFFESGQLLLQKCLEKNFSIRTRVHRKGKYLNLYIPSGEAKRFCALVAPYIIPSLEYKISLDPVTTDPNPKGKGEI